VLFLKGVFGEESVSKMTETLKCDFYDFLRPRSLGKTHYTQKRPLSFLLRPHHLLLFPRGACLCLVSLYLSLCAFLFVQEERATPRGRRFGVTEFISSLN